MATELYLKLKKYYLGEYKEEQIKKRIGRKKEPVESVLNEEDISEVYKKHKYFPMDMLLNDDTDMHFVLGVRGDGKTFNAKKFILKDWFEAGLKSYFIISTKTEMDDMIATKDFHLDLLLDELHELITPEEYAEDIQGKYSDDDIYCHFLAEQVKMDREFLYDVSNDKGDWFCRMIPLSMYHKYKKGKHPRVMRMYFDEFMRESYLKNEAFKVQDLLTSVQREKKDFKMVFLGNAISLNHPMFVALDVYSLDDKVITTGEDDKGKLFKVWKWSRPEAEAEKKNGELLWYRVGDLTGYNDYAVKNNFKNDNITNIITGVTDDLLEEVGEFKHTFKTQDIFVDVWFIAAENNSYKKNIYFFKVNKKAIKAEEVRYALDVEDGDDTTLFRPTMSNDIARKLQRGRLFYDSIATKQSVWQTVKRWF